MMAELKSLLVESLQDLLNAENQIVSALPKMVEAAHNEPLKQAFKKHLLQTEGQVGRLETALQMLGETNTSKACKGMKGLLEEGSETIEEGEDLDDLTADLALITAAQKVEHYEISGYGNARCLAKHLGEREIATLLTHTLGEEEAADFLLSEVTKPLMQQALSVEFGNGSKTPWGEPGDPSQNPAVSRNTPQRSPTASAVSTAKTKKKA
jgi:Mn-containing catalase